MNRSCTILAALVTGLIVASLLAADKPPVSSKDKEALAPLQAYVGSWKGVGQPRRGSVQGSWIEQADWIWKFTDSQAALAFQSPQGKYFASGDLRPGARPGEFELVATLPDGKTVERYVGSLSEERLVLRAAEPAAGRPTQVSFRQVADGDRMLVLLEQSRPGSDAPVRLAEVGYTRQGSGFGQGSSQRECIVTGGYGSIEVQHNGKSYYVCCTGCRDLFNSDPEGVLAEFRERKEKEKAKRK